MDGIPTPAIRARRTKAASGRSRGKSRTGGGGRFRLARRLPVIGVATAVFVAAFVLDTGAVARLVWACLAGQAGEPARFGAAAVVLLLLGLIAVVLYRPAPPAKPRRRAARPPVRADTDEAPRAGKRGGKRGASPATDRSA